MFAPAPPTPSPSVPSTPAAHPGICVPGKDNNPDGWLGRIMCGDLLPHHGPHASSLGQLAAGYAPYAITVIALLIGVRLAWGQAKRTAWRSAAARARWLEIIPPVSATPVTTVALWKMLAGTLAAPGRFTLRPARLVWEVHATADAMRCGIWVPPGINPTAVIQVVRRAWPGARIGEAAVPQLPDRRATLGLRLAPNRPDWLALLDDDVLAPAGTRALVSRSTVDEQDDRLRAVYGGLASAGRSGDTLLQVIVGRAPRARLALARKATTDPGAARRAGRARAAGLLLTLVLAVVRTVLDLLQGLLPTGRSTGSHPSAGSRPADPLADPHLREEARQARGKLATGPHLLVGVRVVATGPTQGAARAAAESTVGGYLLLTSHLGRLRLARPGAAAAWRSAPEHQLMFATVAEVAALAGVPIEPSAYGLPGAAARRRGPGRDTWRWSPPSDGADPTPPGQTWNDPTP